MWLSYIKEETESDGARTSRIDEGVSLCKAGGQRDIPNDEKYRQTLGPTRVRIVGTRPGPMGPGYWQRDIPNDDRNIGHTAK